MKKVVLNVDIRDEKAKQKAMKAVSSLPGINSISMQLKEKKMTVIGEVDPVEVVGKLRKLWFAQILTVGPPKEENKDNNKQNKDNKKPPIYCTSSYPYYYNQYPTHYYVQTAEENPNACVLC